MALCDFCLFPAVKEKFCVCHLVPYAELNTTVSYIEKYSGRKDFCLLGFGAK
jgi:hypothetical protein